MADAESRLVMDANVFVHAYQTVDAPTIRARLASWQAADVVFHVPTLWRYEVTNALCRNIKAGLTSIQRGDETLSKILDLPVEYHDERELHEEATAIALRLNAGAAYDAHYLALALRLNVPFYDRRRQASRPGEQAVPQHRARPRRVGRLVPRSSPCPTSPSPSPGSSSPSSSPLRSAESPCCST